MLILEVDPHQGISRSQAQARTTHPDLGDVCLQRYPMLTDKDASPVPVPLPVRALWPLHVLVAPAGARAAPGAAVAGLAAVPASVLRLAACTVDRPPRSCSDDKVHLCGQTPSGT